MIDDLETQLDMALKRADKKGVNPLARKTVLDTKLNVQVETVALQFTLDQFDIMAHALNDFLANLPKEGTPAEYRNKVADLLLFFCNK